MHERTHVVSVARLLQEAPHMRTERNRGRRESARSMRRESRGLCGAIALMLGLLAGCSSTTEQAQLNVAQVAREMAQDTTPSRLEELGDAAAQFGDMTRAEEYFAAALRRGGDAQRLTRKLVASCVADSRYPLARAHAADYVRLHPTDTRMRYVLASLELATGNSERALVEYMRVVREQPRFAAARYAVGTLLLAKENKELRDEELANEHFRAYLSLEPRGTFAEVARASLSPEGVVQ